MISLAMANLIGFNGLGIGRYLGKEGKAHIHTDKTGASEASGRDVQRDHEAGGGEENVAVNSGLHQGCHNGRAQEAGTGFGEGGVMYASGEE